MNRRSFLASIASAPVALAAGVVGVQAATDDWEAGRVFVGKNGKVVFASASFHGDPYLRIHGPFDFYEIPEGKVNFGRLA